MTRTGPQTILNAQRFIQTGDWSGTIVAEGEEIRVDSEDWVGARDRSWGMRPVGEGAAARRADRAESTPGEGHWHIWAPLRFADFTDLRDRPGAARRHAGAQRGGAHLAGLDRPPAGAARLAGRRDPLPAGHAPSGVRGAAPDAARPAPGQSRSSKTLGFIPLHVGAGYGGDPTWSHGSWKGAGWVEAVSYDYDDPEVAARIPFGVLDHVAAATFTGSDGIKVKGYGVFEHGTFGRHDPSGFLTVRRRLGGRVAGDPSHDAAAISRPGLTLRQAVG